MAKPVEAEVVEVIVGEIEAKPAFEVFQTILDLVFAKRCNRRGQMIQRIFRYHYFTSKKHPSMLCVSVFRTYNFL